MNSIRFAIKQLKPYNFSHKFIYITLDLSKGSSDIGNAVSSLPKGHNWGKVYIDTDYNYAKCIVCNFIIDYNGFEWSAPLTSPYAYVPISCEEHIMSEALK